MQKLIFIYNADAGLRNMIMDGAHKIFSPNTYECNLCDITYGMFTENRTWKAFRKNTDLEMEFLHKDEFAKIYRSKFGYNYTFPIILACTVTGGLEVFVGTDELNTLKRPQDLIQIVEERRKLFFPIT